MGPINYESYKYYSEEIIEKLLETRLKHEDCNAGVIFDNL
jgi:adenylate kinase family enzyme